MLLPLLSLTLATFPAPTGAVLERCRAAACSAFEDVRVCKCQPPNDEQPAWLVVDYASGRRVVWEVEAVKDEVADFHVEAVDLDDDGKSELVITNPAPDDSLPRGHATTVSIVDGAGAEALHFTAHEWGQGSLSAKHTVLASEWERSHDGTPVALMGREFRFEKGHLVPTREPILRRALDAGFSAERTAGGAARAWLSGKGVQRLVADVPGQKLSPATVRGVTRDDGGLEVHLEHGETDFATLSSGGDEGPPLRVGLLKAKRLYPLGYAPGDADALLLGRRVSLAMQGQEPTGVLWLDENGGRAADEAPSGKP